MSQPRDLTGTRLGPLALPPASCRLFAHYARDRLAVDQALDFVIGRLLEEGETDDLKWLARAVSEEHLAEWLRHRGGRQLTRRSRCFWQVVLGSRVTPPAFDPAQLWPL